MFTFSVVIVMVFFKHNKTNTVNRQNIIFYYKNKPNGAFTRKIT